VPAYDAIDVWNDADGVPHVNVHDRAELAERFNLSIAHTEGTAVAAVAETSASGTVGVDIEGTKPLRLAIVKRVLTPAEIAVLRGPGEHPSPLTLWTAKEAALKAAHRFCRALRDVELSWRHPCVLHARVVGEPAPAHRIVVRHERAAAYTVALALCR